MIRLPRLVLLALPIAGLHGGVLLDLDFRNFDEGTRTVRAGTAPPNASPLFRAGGGDIVVEPDRPTQIPSAAPALATGSVLIGAPVKNGGFLQSWAEGPASASYADYVGTPGFGRCAIALVFQPGFSGASNRKGGRDACLFATNFRGTAPEGLRFQIEDRVILAFGLGKAASPGQKVALESPDWDPSKWYFLAASWAPDQKPAVFWKEIGAADSQFATGPEPLIDSPRRIAKAVRLGNSGNQDAELAGEAPLNGRLAYFLWLDDYLADRESFERLRDRVIAGQRAD